MVFSKKPKKQTPPKSHQLIYNTWGRAMHMALANNEKQDQLHR